MGLTIILRPSISRLAEPALPSFQKPRLLAPVIRTDVQAQNIDVEGSPEDSTENLEEIITAGRKLGETAVKIIQYTESESRVFDTLPAKGVAGRVVIGQADGAKNFCMRVFELTPEGHTPRHTHDWEHEIFVHSGVGSVYREGQWVPIRAGNVVFVPPGEEHQIKNTGKASLVFVCLIPAGAPEL
jgi:quercetin dioxygenase-like cupin family protein